MTTNDEEFSSLTDGVGDSESNEERGGENDQHELDSSERLISSLLENLGLDDVDVRREGSSVSFVPDSVESYPEQLSLDVHQQNQQQHAQETQSLQRHQQDPPASSGHDDMFQDYFREVSDEIDRQIQASIDDDLQHELDRQLDEAFQQELDRSNALTLGDAFDSLVRDTQQSVQESNPQDDTMNASLQNDDMYLVATGHNLLSGILGQATEDGGRMNSNGGASLNETIQNVIETYNRDQGDEETGVDQQEIQRRGEGDDSSDVL